MSSMPNSAQWASGLVMAEHRPALQAQHRGEPDVAAALVRLQRSAAGQVLDEFLDVARGVDRQLHPGAVVELGLGVKQAARVRVEAELRNDPALVAAVGETAHGPGREVE